MTRIASAPAALVSTLAATLAPTLASSLGLASAIHAQSAMPALPAGVMPSPRAWDLAGARANAATTPAPAAPTLASASKGEPEARATDAALGQDDVFGHRLTTTPGMRPAPAGDGPFVDLDLAGRVNGSSAFDEGPGSVTTARGGWDARVGWSQGESSSLTLGLHTEASFYDFSGATGLVPGSGDGEPVNDVLEHRLLATLCARSGPSTSWFTTTFVTLASEGNVGVGSAATVGAVAGLTYRANEDIALQVGFAGLSRLEDDPLLFPYFGFDWQVTEGIRLATEGPRVELSAEIADAWALYGNAVYGYREYRLTEDNALPSGVLRDHEIDLAVGVRWTPSASVHVDVGAGIAAWREIEMLDRHGASVSETELDPSPIGQLAIHVAF